MSLQFFGFDRSRGTRGAVKGVTYDSYVIRHTVIILIIGYSGHTGLRCTVGACVGRWDKPVWISRGPVGARQACVTAAPSVRPLVLRCDRFVRVALNAQVRSSSERGAYEYAFSTRVAAERTERRGRRAPEAARSRTRTPDATCGKLGPSGNGRGAYGSSTFCG